MSESCGNPPAATQGHITETPGVVIFSTTDMLCVCGLYQVYLQSVPFKEEGQTCVTEKKNPDAAWVSPRLRRHSQHTLTSPHSSACDKRRGTPSQSSRQASPSFNQRNASCRERERRSEQHLLISLLTTHTRTSTSSTPGNGHPQETPPLPSPDSRTTQSTTRRSPSEHQGMFWKSSPSQQPHVSHNVKTSEGTRATVTDAGCL